MQLNKLIDEIDYKERKGPGGTTLAYIDARQVMDVLDQLVGIGNWQCDYKMVGEDLYCGIGINVAGTNKDTINPSPTWVWKWDVGTESEYDKEKGRASDAFKRAAVKWGIGRFLYDIDPKGGSKKPVETSRGAKTVLLCSNEACEDTITQKVYDFSMSKYGRPLCMKCQGLE